jgi:hypothetical protein
MSTLPSLDVLAQRVDNLLLPIANMAAARQLVESYLDGREKGTVERIPFPPDSDQPDGIGGDAIATSAQRAAALVALRDVFCPGVEKIVPVPANLPVAGDAETLHPECRRVIRWSATIKYVQGLKDNALPWLMVQLRRFKRDLQEQIPRPNTEPEPTNPAVPAPSPTEPEVLPNDRKGPDASGDDRSLFLDFPTKQRLLLTALWDKGNVSKEQVQKAVWDGRLTRAPLDALDKLITRVNAKLAAKDYNLQVQREAQTLKLTPVDEKRPPFPRRQ